MYSQQIYYVKSNNDTVFFQKSNNYYFEFKKSIDATDQDSVVYMMYNQIDTIHY